MFEHDHTMSLQIMESWQATTLLVHASVRSIVVLPNRDTYFTNSTGLWKATYKQTKPQIVLHGNFTAVVWDGKKSLFAATDAEIVHYRLDTSSQVVKGFAERELWKVMKCWGLAVDQYDSELYVFTMWHINCCYKWRKINLKQKTHQDTTISNKLACSQGVACADGIVYVTDSKAHCVRVINQDSTEVVAGCFQDDYVDGVFEHAKFGHPRSMAMDRDGSLLIVDDYGLRRIDLKKKVVSTVHVGGVMQCVTTDDRGNIYIGTLNGIVMLENMWKWERYLWIGKLKEQSYCPLAVLPMEIVKEIGFFMKTATIPLASTNHKRKRNDD